MKHTIRPAAKDDILRQFRYYLVDRDKPELANRFVEAVDKTVEKILRMPNVSAPKHLSNPSLAGLRSWPVEEFEDIRVYYLTERDQVRIIRVLHRRRDIQRILEREE